MFVGVGVCWEWRVQAGTPQPQPQPQPHATSRCLCGALGHTYAVTRCHLSTECFVPCLWCFVPRFMMLYLTIVMFVIAFLILSHYNNQKKICVLKRLERSRDTS